MLRARLLFAVFLGISLPASARSDEIFRFPEGKHGKGELKYIHDIPVLTLAGSPEEMGEQAGVLAVKPAPRLLTYPQDVLQMVLKPRLSGAAYDSTYKIAWGYFLRTAETMTALFPSDYKRELEATIKASGVGRTPLIVGNTMFDAKNVFFEFQKNFGCSVLIAEPERSATGKMLFGRNLDFPSAGYLNEYSMVVISRPDGKHAFAAVSFPGILGCLTGMNDAGLTLAVLEVYTSRDDAPKFDPTGTPYALCFRRILEECTTVEEAEKLLRSMKRSTLINLAICDTKRSAVLEITPKSVVVRNPDLGLCSCTNHFRTEALATSTVCRRYDILCKTQSVPKLDVPTMAKCLDAVNQNDHTLQTMIFEPEALKLHLAIGKCPTSALPYQSLDLGPLLKR